MLKYLWVQITEKKILEKKIYMPVFTTHWTCAYAFIVRMCTSTTAEHVVVNFCAKLVRERGALIYK